MRILVMSDGHGAKRPIEQALDAQRDAKAVFYLGDGLSAFEQACEFYPSIKVYKVRGNCDFGSDEIVNGVAVEGGVRILYTHGHNFGVKYGTERLVEAAKSVNAQIVLFGHTHKSFLRYEDGIYLFNPGSLTQAREGKNGYGVIDITDKGIMPIHISF